MDRKDCSVSLSHRCAESMITGLGCAALLISTGQVRADEKGTQHDQVLVARTRSVGDVKPRPIAQAEWRIPGFNRTNRIYQADTTDPTAKRLFFLAPPLALVENPNPISDFPSVVHGVFRNSAGGTSVLDFKLVLSLDSMKPLAKAEVAAQFGDGLRQAGVRPDQVEIRRWPMTHAVIDCKLGRRLLATGQTDSLVSVDDTIEFALEFTAEALADFLEGARVGKVTFVVAYTFENQRVIEGKLTHTASLEVRRAIDDVIRNTLTEAQRNGSQPILLKQIHELKQACRLEATRVVRATSKEVLPLLTEQNSPVNGYFALKDTMKWDDLENNDAMRTEVAKYLAPLVAAWSASDARTSAETPEREWRLETTTKPKGGLDFKIPVIDTGVSGSIEHAKTSAIRDILKREYGINTKRGEDGKYIVPVDVQVYRFTGGPQTMDTAGTQLVYLGVGPSSDYFEDSPVPITFTADKLKWLVANAELPQPARPPHTDVTRAAVERDLRRAINHEKRCKQALIDAAREYHDVEANYQAALKELAVRQEGRKAAHSALAAAHAQWDAQEESLRPHPNPFVWMTKKQTEDSKRKLAEFRAEKYGTLEIALTAAEETELAASARAKLLGETSTDARRRQDAAERALEMARNEIERLEDQLEELKAVDKRAEPSGS